LVLKGGGLIQAKIVGHPPIPLAQNRVFHLGSFSIAFQVLDFWGHFEALNIVFWAHHTHTICFSHSVMEKYVFLGYTFQMSYCAPNEDRMQKLRLWEIDVPTYHIEAHMNFGVSSSGFRFLDFIYVKKASKASL
jgi:hypothetical protein